MLPKHSWNVWLRVIFQLEVLQKQGASSFCVSYCILPLLGRSPDLTVVYIISTVFGAQCKYYNVSFINTHRIPLATERLPLLPCVALLSLEDHRTSS